MNKYYQQIAKRKTPNHSSTIKNGNQITTKPKYFILPKRDEKLKHVQYSIARPFTIFCTTTKNSFNNFIT